MSEKTNMKTMKFLKVDVKVRKQFVVTLHGEPIGVFEEKAEMAGMKLLSDIGKGSSLVLDFPIDIIGMLSGISNGGGNSKFEATVVKLSSDLMVAIREAIDNNTEVKKTVKKDKDKDKAPTEPPNATCEESG